MTEFERFAIYYLPPPGPLAAIGAAWLGWDPEARTEAATGDFRDRVPGWPALVETPRRYGFHATLKAPFGLAAGATVEHLDTELAAFAAKRPPAIARGLRLAAMGGFLALVPEGDAAEIGDLAAELVTRFDRYRAPATAGELARRRAAGLTDAQEANLVAWGYPYVFGEFRFHMTLTGRLDDPERARVGDALAPVLAPVLPKPFGLSGIALVGEGADGRFRLIRRYSLEG